MSDGYPLRPLGEVMRLEIQRTPMKPATTYRLAGVLNAGQGLVAKGEFDGGATEYAAMNVLHVDQVVMRKLTAWEGPITVVPAEFDGFVVSNEFPTFTLGPEVMPDWIRHVCRSPRLWVEMKNRVSGTVQRRKRLNPEQLLQIQLPIPPRKVQARIVEVLDAVDNQVTSLNGETERLSRVMGGIGEAEWGTDADTAIGKLARVVTGSTPKTSVPENWDSEDIPFVTPGDLGKFERVNSFTRYVSKRGAGASRLIEELGLPVVCIGATIGKLGLIEGPFVTNQQINTVTNMPAADLTYLGLVLSSACGQAALWGRAGQTAVPLLNKSSFSEIRVPWPESERRALLAEAADAIGEVIVATRIEADRLRAVRAGLLSGLLDRTIDIKAAEMGV